MREGKPEIFLALALNLEKTVNVNCTIRHYLMFNS